MKKALVAVLALAAIALGAQPAFGDDVGTVSAQVSVAAPCLQVTPGQLDFGTLGFSQSNANLTGGTQPVTATNCGSAAHLLGHGSNATSTAGTTWTLDPTGDTICPDLNRYGQRIDTGPVSITLTAQDRTLRDLAAAEAASLNAIVVMPCAGSAGAGQTMTFSYVFTAVSS
jgi:hypothetical protein